MLFGYKPDCWDLFTRPPPKNFTFVLSSSSQTLKESFHPDAPPALIIHDHKGLLQRRRGTRADTQNQSACCCFSPSGLDSCDAADLYKEDERLEDTSGNQTLSDNQTDATLKTSFFVSKADSTRRVTGLIVSAEQMWDVRFCSFFFLHIPQIRRRLDGYHLKEDVFLDIQMLPHMFTCSR